MTAGRPRAPITIAGTTVPAGSAQRVELPIARLMSGAPITLPVLVVHGRQEGPTVWLSGAVHGDELEGVEIIRRVTRRLDPQTLRGTVLAVPVVNVYGFNTGDRYLPDRRDLNRSFPGSSRGSLASRLARLFMTEVVARCEAGIDLHTGSDDRANFPQLRIDVDDIRTRALAEAFAPPVILHSRTRDGSLRQAATEAGVTVLLYEGGEASRFEESSISLAAQGVERVMGALDMLPDPPEPGGDDGAAQVPFVSRRSRWVRAPRSGILHLAVALGDDISPGEVVAEVTGPFGSTQGRCVSRAGGRVIGIRRHPLVNRGDAVAHVAELDGARSP